MEMTELQQAWGRIEARLEDQGRMLARMQRQRGLDSVRTRLRWLSLALVMEVVVGGALMAWAGSYWVAHRAQLHLLVYGLSLHAYGLGLLWFAAAQWFWLASLDYQSPVLVVQRKLHALRRLRVLGGRVMLAAGMVAWVPLVLIALRGLGVDLWLTRPVAVWMNLGVGLGLAAGMEWLARRRPESWSREHAGRLLNRAAAELDALADPDATGRMIDP